MAAFSYAYHIQGLQKNPIEVVSKVLTELAESEEGLTPKSLLDASRDVNAPLHNEFEWNDGVAAEKYRQYQAQKIIQNVYIQYSTDETERKEKQERAFVPTPDRQSVYVTLKSALTNEQWKAHLLEDAQRDIRSFVAKYRRLTELQDLIKGMEEFLKVG